MAEPFLAEIRICSFNFAPKGWAMCNGQLLPINQNQAVFSLMGTTYGGDGRVNFALPNLQGRSPMHRGGGYVLGQIGGEQSHTLSVAELPTHTHAMRAADVTGRAPISGRQCLGLRPRTLRRERGCRAAFVDDRQCGGSQAHLNLPPFLALNFVVALQGIFPSPN